MKKRILALVLVFALALALGIGGTMAWLTATSGEVINTFTVGDINITLTETKGTVGETAGVRNFIGIVPGGTVDKDPTVAVTAGSEDCYLFVKIDESDNLDDFIVYAVADGWTEVTDYPGVYYRTAKAGDSFEVIGNKGFENDKTFVKNKVLVRTSVTKAMSDAIEKDPSTAPTLTFTAYAIQSVNVANDGETEEQTVARLWKDNFAS